MKLIVWSACLVSMCGSVAVAESEWRGFRGPTSNGVAPEGEYPTRWSATENVAWRIDLPGPGSSTPAVTAERIVITAARDGENAVLCYSRDGQLQWETLVGTERPGKNKKASGANPTAAIDDQHIYAYFKSGDLAALDFTGKIVWQTNLQDRFGPDDLWWDLGTSPVRTSRHVVIAVMQTETSYIAAFYPRSGELAWKADRNLGAPEEAAQSYSTPVVVRHNGQEQLVVLGADHITCHAAANGQGCVHPDDF